MATFRKALEYLGLVDADDEYADDGYYDDEYIDEEPTPVAAGRTRTHAIAHAPEPVGPVTVVRPIPRESPAESATISLSGRFGYVCAGADANHRSHSGNVSASDQ